MSSSQRAHGDPEIKKLEIGKKQALKKYDQFTINTKVELISKPAPTHTISSYFPPTFKFLNSLLS